MESGETEKRLKVGRDRQKGSRWVSRSRGEILGE